MKILQWVYTVYSILIFIILMFLFGLFITLSLLLGPKSGKISFFFIRIWAKIWSWLSGICYEIHGREHVKPNQPYVYSKKYLFFIVKKMKFNKFQNFKTYKGSKDRLEFFVQIIFFMLFSYFRDQY